jgi:hypothetical protein
MSENDKKMIKELVSIYKYLPSFFILMPPRFDVAPSSDYK